MVSPNLSMTSQNLSMTSQNMTKTSQNKDGAATTQQPNMVIKGELKLNVKNNDSI